MKNATLKSMVTNATLLESLLDKFGNRADGCKTLLANTDITLGNLKSRFPKASVYDELNVLNNISIIQGADWVWRHPDLWNPKNSDPLSRAIKHAPNCHEAFNILTRFGSFWGTNYFFEQFKESEKEGGRHVLTMGLISDIVHNEPENLFARDIMIMRIYALFHQILGPKCSHAELHFTGEMRSVLGKNDMQFLCPVKFLRRRNAFSIPLELSGAALPSADRSVFLKAIMTLEKAIGPTEGEDAFLLKVRNYLRAVTDGRPSAAQAANALGVSTRTMNRRLQENGTSYRSMLEISLERRAKKMLSSQNLSRAEISERLGYNDQASFSRALRRWKQNA